MFFKAIVAAVVVACVFGYRANMQMKAEVPSFKKFVAGALAGVFATGSFQMPAQALTKAETLSLSYEQVKGSGFANRCPDVIGEEVIAVQGGKKYKFTDLCIEPKNFQVEEEVSDKKGSNIKTFVNVKLMTRQTYTLDGISGVVENVNGKAVFTEKDGIDYAATTVQTPGGERVPFLFTVKDLVATGNGDKIKPGFEFGGSFTVPSYRTGLFLDPKGRGTTTGYDQAGALPGIQNGVEGDAFMFNENNKRFDVLSGDIEFAVNKVNEAEGEFGGVFVSNQPGDTDMGGKAPKRILIKGSFYGHLEPL